MTPFLIWGDQMGLALIVPAGVYLMSSNPRTVLVAPRDRRGGAMTLSAVPSPQHHTKGSQ